MSVESVLSMDTSEGLRLCRAFEPFRRPMLRGQRVASDTASMSLMSSEALFGERDTPTI